MKAEMVFCFQNCSSDQEKLLRSLLRPIYSNSEKSERFFKQNAFLTYSWRFLRSKTLEQNYWDSETCWKS